MDEKYLRQLFKNRSNCYADADSVIQAMDEDCFIETLKEALRQTPVISSVCKKCEQDKYKHSMSEMVDKIFKHHEQTDL